MQARRNIVGAVVACSVILAACLLPATARAVPLQGEVSASLGRFGTAATEIEDQSADGRWEILVGAPDVDLAGTDAGRAYLWFGGLGLPLSANLVLSGQATGERFGHAVARIGDVNDDGHSDFAVGAPNYSFGGQNRGRVYVFFGGPGLDATPDAVIESPSTTSQFGFSISAAGDFNGDGCDDLIVGAPYGDVNGVDAGEAYVCFGASSLGQLIVVDLTLLGPLPGDHFGWSVSDAGNFFRDGVPSVVVGAPANTAGILRPGSALVYRGSTEVSPGPDTIADVTLTSSSVNPAQSWFGYSVRGIGDWDGDGAEDIAVGAPNDQVAGAGAGRIEIFFGGTSPDGTGDRYVKGVLAGDQFGFAVADVGQVIGSARPDVLIGAPGQDASGANAGRAYLYAGGSASYESANSLTAVPAQGVSPGTLPNDVFGFWVTSAGDFDGDGVRDYAVCAPGGNIHNGAEAGYVQLYASSGNVVATALRDWCASWTPSGTVRLEFALLQSPEDVAHLSVWRAVAVVGADAGPRVIVCSGPPDPETMPLVIRGEFWTLLDHPEPLREGESLRYALRLVFADGGEIALENLEGPPAGGPPAGRLELRPAYPNPFNPRTVIPFRAPAGEHVTCRVVDMRGRVVEVLFDGVATGALQSAVWDGRADGRPVPAGVYAVQLVAGERVQTRRVVLAK